MNVNQLNYLNIGLMIASCVVAFILPFELFLFSYAILGPLHYLTEISWLHKRQYFTPGKKDGYILAGLALTISLANMIPYFYTYFGPKDIDDKTIYTPEIMRTFTGMYASLPALNFIAFAGAALMILAQDVRKRVIGFLLIALVGYAFHADRMFLFSFAIFLPTLVHVFVFTGAFLLLGTLKNRTLSGALSLITFIACAVSLFVLFPNTITPPGPFTDARYSTSLIIFNQQLFDALLHKQADKNMIYHSMAGIMFTRFTAFAYTYHYLNWFSKTSVIKWHQVPKRSLIILGVIWACSVALYAINYITGLMALYFLSYLHVIFEFPLNFRSFKDIGMQFRLMLRPGTA